MKRIIYCCLIMAILICPDQRSSFAAFQEEMTSEETANMIEGKRANAQQEYYTYMQQKKAEAETEAPAQLKPVLHSEAKVTRAKFNKNSTAGTIFLLVAIILSLYMFWYSKRK